MAVEIKMTGICEDCPCADLEIDSSVSFAYSKPQRREWTIRCTKASACNRILEKERNRLFDPLRDAKPYLLNKEGNQNE